MTSIAAGVVKFQKETYPHHRELFEKLATGQAPEVMFITCADSRIDPAMITTTQPGDLFVLRNAGNIVPPHGDHASGMGASIEFAIKALGVTHVVVCGHTQCGAMKGATDLAGLDSLPQVQKWLAHAQDAVKTVAEKAGDADESERMAMLLRENVLLQLEHLKSHPAVSDGLESGKLKKSDVEN